MVPVPDIARSLETAVTATVAALGTALSSGALYVLVSSTNAWVKQGQTKLVTCVTKANFADSDYVVIDILLNGVVTSTATYEFDTAGNGVTTGRTQVNISTDTTAAQCATRLRTAILATQTTLEVIDNTDGTLTITSPGTFMNITEHVANAGFLVAAATVPATAAAGSMLVPALYPVYIDGTRGPQVGIIRNTADGLGTITPVMRK